MQIHFATWLFDRHLGNALTKCNGKHRLLSYYFLVQGEVTEKDLKKYIYTGVLDTRKSK